MFCQTESDESMRVVKVSGVRFDCKAKELADAVHDLLGSLRGASGTEFCIPSSSQVPLHQHRVQSCRVLLLPPPKQKETPNLINSEARGSRHAGSGQGHGTLMTSNQFSSGSTRYDGETLPEVMAFLILRSHHDAVILQDLSQDTQRRIQSFSRDAAAPSASTTTSRHRVNAPPPPPPPQPASASRNEQRVTAALLPSVLTLIPSLSANDQALRFQIHRPDELSLRWHGDLQVEAHSCTLSLGNLISSLRPTTPQQLSLNDRSHSHQSQCPQEEMHQVDAHPPLVFSQWWQHPSSARGVQLRVNPWSRSLTLTFQDVQRSNKALRPDCGAISYSASSSVKGKGKERTSLRGQQRKTASKARADSNMKTSSSSSSSLIKLIIGFQSLRSKIRLEQSTEPTVRSVQSSASDLTATGCKSCQEMLGVQSGANLYTLIIEVSRPPEVRRKIGPELLQRALQFQLKQWVLSQGGQDNQYPKIAARGPAASSRAAAASTPQSGSLGVKMMGGEGSAAAYKRPLSSWPTGGGQDDRLEWTVSGDWTGVGAVGGCYAYRISLRDDGQGTVQRLLQTLVEFGLLEPAEAMAVLPQSRLREGWRLSREITEIQIFQPQHWLALEGSLVSGGMHKKVAYALMCLVTCGQLPRELVSPSLIDLLKAQDYTVAEAGLYDCLAVGAHIREATSIVGAALAAVRVRRSGTTKEPADLLQYLIRIASAGVSSISDDNKPRDEMLTNVKHLVDAIAAVTPVGSASGGSGLGQVATEGSVDAAESNICFTKRLLITPTRVVCLPPELDLSNRVLRNFKEHQEHFIRVAFGDELGEQVFLATSQPECFVDRRLPKLGEEDKRRKWEDPYYQDLRNRMVNFLRHGIVLLEERFELLAFSSNQLRSAGAWFMSSVYSSDDKDEVDLSTEHVRYWIGDFSHIKNRAKFASRLGQAFTCTFRALPCFKYKRPAQQWISTPPLTNTVVATLDAAVLKGPIQSVSATGVKQALFRNKMVNSHHLDPESVSNGGSASALMDCESGEDQSGYEASISLPSAEADSALMPSVSELFEESPAEEEPDPTDFVMIPDIEVCDEEDHEGRAKYITSDGVMRVSLDVAADMMEALGLSRERPLACQVRLGGCKGMLVPWGSNVMPPGLIQIRPSAKKFDSIHTDVEVVQVASFVPGFINRQIIILLLALGLSGDVFLRRATSMIGDLDSMLSTTSKAVQIVKGMGYLPASMSRVVLASLSAGFQVSEPMLQSLLQYMRAHALLQLRRKTRIYLEHSAFLFGVLDEIGVLNENQVFLQYQRPGMETPQVLSGVWVLVTKNPCLHPGDIRVLRATDNEALRHIVNCVVFPKNVSRPHSNAIGGSDLDGDMYFCCWDSQVVPMDDLSDWPHMEDPADYTGMQPRTEKDIQVDPHLIEFFMDFQMNDMLGQIANAHVALSDQEKLGAASEGCKQLTRLHSVAVDYPKTGITARLEEWHRPKLFPHFMEKENRSYHSKTILGKLYDLAVGAELQLSSPQISPEETMGGLAVEVPEHLHTHVSLPATAHHVRPPAVSTEVALIDPLLTLDKAEGWRQEESASSS
ncbi:hypothetical protein CEUSTIGMA_g11819.t1 [Chlamydomonas eustigma]|uniref:RDRP core domain-containing protein n=1 Tax=Chlamydomonas eustigma TaxID=1157962 RepID=A0A250XMV6_9CHLO|nr:hypothetical protein CEUSTIGMA_g11819.t1 [Chlamydomonas eustigma]|eukprot:GAX84397.1 hypothetical protein CEUSTIGMA_g11819.t1 [Chlamydomonas eustigma]